MFPLLFNAKVLLTYVNKTVEQCAVGQIRATAEHFIFKFIKKFIFYTVVEGVDDLYLISQGDEVHVQLFHTVVGAQLGDLDQGRVAGGHTLLDSAQPRGTARRHRL